MDHIDCLLLREDGLCMIRMENGHEALPFVWSFSRMESYEASGYLERSLTPPPPPARGFGFCCGSCLREWSSIPPPATGELSNSNPRDMVGRQLSGYP